MYLTLLLAQAAHGASLSLGPPGPTASDGTVRIPVLLQAGPGEGVASLQFSLEAARRAYQVVGVEAGPAAIAAGKEVTLSTRTQQPQVVVMGMNIQTIASGEVAALIVQVDGKTGQRSTIALDRAVLAGPLGETIRTEVDLDPVSVNESDTPEGESPRNPNGDDSETDRSALRDDPDDTQETPSPRENTGRIAGRDQDRNPTNRTDRSGNGTKTSGAEIRKRVVERLAQRVYEQRREEAAARVQNKNDESVAPGSVNGVDEEPRAVPTPDSTAGGNDFQDGVYGTKSVREISRTKPGEDPVGDVAATQDTGSIRWSIRAAPFGIVFIVASVWLYRRRRTR